MTAFVTVSARAEPQGVIEIELNALQQRNDACRLSMLFRNRLGKPIEDLTMELVLFGKDGGVVTMIAANGGAFPENKSRLKQFDLARRECKSLGRLLLNDITKCAGIDLTPALCTASARPTSRAGIPFSY